MSSDKSLNSTFQVKLVEVKNRKQFTPTFRQNDSELLKRELFCDVRLRIGRRTFNAHRGILALNSPFFWAMFTSKFQEERMPEVELKELDENNFSSILEVIYGLPIEITDENVEGLFATANFLQLDQLKKYCGEFLHEYWVIGGSHNVGTNNSVMIFNAKKGIWRQGKEMNEARCYHSVGVDANQIFAFGGHKTSTSAEVFDLNTESWTNLPAMPNAISYAGAVTINRKTYFCGGPDRFCGGSRNVGKRVIVYDHADKSWSDCPNMIRSRADPSVVEFKGVIYALGGRGEKSGEKYENGVWELIPEMANERWAAAATVLDGLIYVAGGACGGAGQDFLSSVEAFDPAKNSWKTLKSMQEPRNDFGLSTIGNQLIAFGGYNGRWLNSVEIYNPRDNTWSFTTPMPEARAYHALIKI